MIGFVVLIAITVGVAIPAHRRIPTYWSANLVAGALSSVLFQVAVTIQLGYMDPFAPIALFTGGVIAFGVSAIIGGALRSLGLTAASRNQE